MRITPIEASPRRTLLGLLSRWYRITLITQNLRASQAHKSTLTFFILFTQSRIPPLGSQIVILNSVDRPAAGSQQLLRQLPLIAALCAKMDRAQVLTGCVERPSPGGGSRLGGADAGRQKSAAGGAKRDWHFQNCPLMNSRSARDLANANSFKSSSLHEVKSLFCTFCSKRIITLFAERKKTLQSKLDAIKRNHLFVPFQHGRKAK